MPFDNSRKWGLVILTMVTIIAMFAAAVVDMDWTMAIGRIDRPLVEELMNRSLFEGEGLGANDLVIFLLLGVIFVYYMGWRRNANAKPWIAWRPQSGFVLTSALVTAVYFVHGCKLAIGRARPDLVFDNKMAFSHWFSFGPHFVTDGLFSGSFPSGHTSQMFILMAGAFIVFGDPLLSRRTRNAGKIWAFFSILASFAMGIVRCMTNSHWLTDIMGSVLFGWIIMHLLYYTILRVPDQRRFMADHGTLPEMPGAWEIIFCIHLFVGILGLTMATVGARSIVLQKSPWLALLLPGGIGCIAFSWKRATVLLRGVWSSLEPKSPDP